MPILVFLGFSVLELGPMYATDRQTDVRETDIRRRLMPPPYGDGGLITALCKLQQSERDHAARGA